MNSLLLHFDQARLGKFHLTLMLIAGSCWIWAAYGVTIVGFMLPALQAEWNVSSSALGILAGISMFGMLVGAVIGGTMSDRFGRRRMLTWIMLYLGAMFILSSVAANYTILLVVRFLTGMGLGAILPTSGTLVAEFSPVKYRGTMVVLMNGFWGLGGTLAAVVGYYLVLHYGWRPAMLFGGLAGIASPLIHYLLPESLRYLLGRGRMEEAYLEAARTGVEIPILTSIPWNNEKIDPQKPVIKGSGIWSKNIARITATLWILWIALNFLYQGVFIWLPTLLAGAENSFSRSFLLTLFISLGQIPGTLLVAYLADRTNRRNLMIFSLGLLGTCTVIFSILSTSSWVLPVGFMLMVFNGMAWGLAHPFSSELYPTSMRGTATGWATGIGRMGGVVAPLIIGWVIQAGGGMMITFSILAAAPAVAIVALSGLRLETTGHSLEEISGE